MTTCLYVASPSYSGSTMLTLLLGAHPEIATVGELKGGQEDLATYQCSCGTLFKECSFWRSLNDALAGSGYRYDLADRGSMPAYRSTSGVVDALLRRRYGGILTECARTVGLAVWPGAQRLVGRVHDYHRVVIREVLRLTGGSVFVDSSKDPIRIRYLSAMPDLDVRVVHLVRDGRGTINSARKNANQPVARAAKEWRDTHLEIERVSRRCAQDRRLLVRYEDLCADPSSVLSCILSFASLPPDNSISHVDGSRLHVLGNRMRLKGRQDVRLEESWRQELSDMDLAAFQSIGGELNRRYGYDDESRTPTGSPSSLRVLQRA